MIISGIGRAVSVSPFVPVLQEPEEPELEAPTVQASGLAVVDSENDNQDIELTRGDGDFVIVLRKAGSAVDANPVDDTIYTVGNELGTGNFVVYIGTGTSFNVDSLASDTNQHYAAFEFNVDGDGRAYLTTSPSTTNELTFTDEYQAILDSAIGTPPSTFAGRKVDNLFWKDMVDNGLFAECDAVWMMTTAGDASYALINGVNPGSNTGTIHGTVSPSYTEKDGFHGNAAQEAYIDFHWNPSDNGVKFLQNDSSIHAYTTDDNQHTAPLLGCANASAVGRLFVTHRDELDRVEINVNSASAVSGGTGGAGLISGVRSASNSQQAYRNGTQEATDTDTSSSVSTFDLVGFAVRTDSGIQFHQDGQLGLVIVGSSSITPSTLDTIWDNHLSRIAGL